MLASTQCFTGCEVLTMHLSCECGEAKSVKYQDVHHEQIRLWFHPGPGIKCMPSICKLQHWAAWCCSGPKTLNASDSKMLVPALQVDQAAAGTCSCQ